MLFNSLNVDTVINSSTIDDYMFSPKFATNYGDSLDINSTSIFIYQSDLEIIRTDNERFDIFALRVYQVSESPDDTLVIKGYADDVLKYHSEFVDVDGPWQTLVLSYSDIDKMIIKGKNDYNLDNFLFIKAE